MKDTFEYSGMPVLENERFSQGPFNCSKGVCSVF